MLKSVAFDKCREWSKGELIGGILIIPYNPRRMWLGVQFVLLLKVNACIAGFNFLLVLIFASWLWKHLSYNFISQGNVQGYPGFVFVTRQNIYDAVEVLCCRISTQDHFPHILMLNGPYFEQLNISKILMQVHCIWTVTISKTCINYVNCIRPRSCGLSNSISSHWNNFCIFYSGSTTTVQYCILKGAPIAENSDLRKLCSECGATTILPPDTFPRTINEVLCRKGGSEASCLTVDSIGKLFVLLFFMRLHFPLLDRQFFINAHTSHILLYIIWC